jgi:hypothetical protein
MAPAEILAFHGWTAVYLGKIWTKYQKPDLIAEDETYISSPAIIYTEAHPES